MPTVAQSYIDTHFPDIAITQVLKDRDGLRNNYEVYLKDGTALEFDRKGADVVLFIKDQHRFFVINRINNPKGDQTMLISDQNGVTENPSHSFVTVIKSLDIG